MNANKGRSVFQGTHLVESMRSSGYKNTAYALAEIIDNSVEAQAKHIEIICTEKQNYATDPPSKQLDEIAVVDDGTGMSKKELWDALIMGEGTRYNTKGIGKFGMGLPNSSLSQCKKVTVYTWRKNKTMSTLFDITKAAGGILNVPPPTDTNIPTKWINKSRYAKKSKHGTMVIWSEIDRVQWKRTSTLLKNFERIVGRIYRKFIHNNNVSIRFVVYDLDTNEKTIDRCLLPNDPLYLMAPSSTPKPWNNKPMFIGDGKYEEKENIKGYNVTLRYTLASKDARKEINGIRAGSQPHGKHANHNLGISIIRAERELYLDTNLCQTYDPLERWWSVEVDFPTELDDVFGVSNNKQDASNFSAMTHAIGSQARNEEENTPDMYEGDADNLRQLVEKINARIRSMRQGIKRTHRGISTKPTEPAGDYDDPDPEPTVTSEQEKSMSDEQREQAIIEALSKIYDPETASQDAKHILDKKLKTVLRIAPLESYNFFDVSLKGGVTIITLNEDHLAYKYLIKTMESNEDNKESSAKDERLNNIRAAMNLLFVSWGFYENHTLSDEKRMELSDVRYNWSKRLNELMKSLYG